MGDRHLKFHEVRDNLPVFEGDTVYARSEVVATRESKSHPDCGLVTVRTTGYKQDEKPVVTFLRTVMVYRRGRDA